MNFRNAAVAVVAIISTASLGTYIYTERGKGSAQPAVVATGAVSTDASGTAQPKPEPRHLPTQTALDVSTDNNGFRVVRLQSGKVVPHVFEIAMLALEGRERLARGKNADAQAANKDQSNSLSTDSIRQDAYKWLLSNSVPVGSNGLLWRYSFDNAYNDIEVKAPWGSAFSQAYIIKAFAKAYKETGDEKYRELAQKAAYPFSVDVSKGGFMGNVDGHPFFEEIPIKNPPHILNGHMIASIALLEEGRRLKNAEMEKLGERGVETLKALLPRYDIGYWSRYDLNPRKFEIPVRLVPNDAPSAAGFLFDRITISEQETGKSIELDVGSENDDTGAWRVAGIDWNHRVTLDGRTARTTQFGPGQRTPPYPLGSRQNSYIYIELPTQSRDLTGTERWTLAIDYFDAAPSQMLVQTQVVDQGNFMKYRTVSGGYIETNGTNTWRTAYITLNSADLAWYMGAEYQVYHVKLLKQLHELTGEQLFKTYADRWQGYLEQHDDINPDAVARGK